MNVLSLDNLKNIIHLNECVILKNMILSSNYSDLSCNENKTVWVFCLSLSWMTSGLQYWMEYYYQYFSYSLYLLSSQYRDCHYKDEWPHDCPIFVMGIHVLRRKSLYLNWCMSGVCGSQWGIIPHQYWSVCHSKQSLLWGSRLSGLSHGKISNSWKSHSNMG